MRDVSNRIAELARFSAEIGWTPEGRLSLHPQPTGPVYQPAISRPARSRQ